MLPVMTRQRAIPALSRWVTVNVPGVGPAKVTYEHRDGRDIVVVKPIKDRSASDAPTR